MRVSDKDLKAAIKPIFNRDQDEVDSPVVEMGKSYGVTGELVTADEEVFASSSVNSHNNKLYKVAINRRNVLRNPHDKFLIQESLRLGKQMARDPYLLVETTEVGFNAYLKFLQTKDVQQLQLAQRKIK